MSTSTSTANTLPGDRLAHRLAPDEGADTKRKTAVAVGIFGVIFTLIALGMFYAAYVNIHWIVSIFPGLFVLVGLGVIAYSIRTALIAWGVGETILEVEKIHAAPGESFKVLVRQHGNMVLNELSVWLVCVEHATFVGEDADGKSSTTKRTEVISEARLGSRSSVTLSGTAPEELAVEARIPDAAMHTFTGKNNGIQWALEVRGDVQRWPDFKHSYTIQVPATLEGSPV